MLIIEENKIYITKGDDAVIELDMTIDGALYEMQAGDVLTLTVREKPVDSEPVLLQAQGIPGSRQIALVHEDTEKLAAGQYSADIQLTTQDGRRITVWPMLEGANRKSTSNNKTFNVMPEVTTT